MKKTKKTTEEERHIGTAGSLPVLENLISAFSEYFRGSGVLLLSSGSVNGMSIPGLPLSEIAVYRLQAASKQSASPEYKTIRHLALGVIQEGEQLYAVNQPTLLPKSGVKELWVLDLQRRNVSVYLAQNGKFVERGSFSEGESLQSPLFSNLIIPVKTVFADAETGHVVHEPVSEYGQLDLNGTYTYWNYLHWQFKERVELIRGKIFKMSPAPNLYHQRISRNLSMKFGTLFPGPDCEVFYAPFDVRLPVANAQKDSTVVQPDLCVVCDKTKLDIHGCNGAPDLAVEILSPGNSRHEMGVKFKAYEQSGVKEYWMVDFERKLVLLYTLKKGVYIGLHPFTESDVIQSPLFPVLRIKVDEIFHQVT